MALPPATAATFARLIAPEMAHLRPLRRLARSPRQLTGLSGQSLQRCDPPSAAQGLVCWDVTQLVVDGNHRESGRGMLPRDDSPDRDASQR